MINRCGPQTEGERAEADLLVAEAFVDRSLWVTAKGEEIPLCDLTHSHLARIINLMKRELLAVHTGGWPQGEQAGWALESAIGQREDELAELEAEQRRRREEAFP